MNDPHQAKLLWLRSCPESLRKLVLHHLDERNRKRVSAGLQALQREQAAFAGEDHSHHVARMLLGCDGPLEMVEISIRRHPASAVARLFPEPVDPGQEVAILLLSLGLETLSRVYEHLGAERIRSLWATLAAVPLLEPSLRQRVLRDAERELGITPDCEDAEILARMVADEPKIVRQVLQRLQHTLNRYVAGGLTRAQIQAAMLQCLPEPLLRFWMQDLSLEEFLDLSLATRHVCLTPDERDGVLRRLYEMLGKPQLGAPKTLDDFARRHPDKLAAYLENLLSE